MLAKNARLRVRNVSTGGRPRRTRPHSLPGVPGAAASVRSCCVGRPHNAAVFPRTYCLPQRRSVLRRNCCATHNSCCWARSHAQPAALGPTVAVEGHLVLRLLRNSGALGVLGLRGCNECAQQRRSGGREQSADAAAKVGRRGRHALPRVAKSPWPNYPALSESQVREHPVCPPDARRPCTFLARAARPRAHSGGRGIPWCRVLCVLPCMSQCALHARVGP